MPKTRKTEPVQAESRGPKVIRFQPILFDGQPYVPAYWPDGYSGFGPVPGQPEGVLGLLPLFHRAGVLLLVNAARVQGGLNGRSPFWDEPTPLSRMMPVIGMQDHGQWAKGGVR